MSEFGGEKPTLGETSENIEHTDNSNVTTSTEVVEEGVKDEAVNEEGEDEEEEEEEKEVYKGPADRLVTPFDVSDIKEDDDSVFVIGTKEGKVTKIDGLENMKKVKEIVLRSCLVSSMQGVETLTTLTKLELYDNQLERISHLENLQMLTILDISFNSIRDMSPVAELPLLEELYIAQNKLRKISGLDNLHHLRILDLGANRIRVRKCVIFWCYLVHFMRVRAFI